MKKSTLLSLLTAASIVLTSAGTYAAWDKTQAATNATVKFREPVTVTVSNSYNLQKIGQAKLGSAETAKSTVNFNVSNPGDLATKLILTPSVSGYEGASAEHFNFTIEDTQDGDTNILKSGNVFTDSDLTSTSYNVTVKPIDDLGDEIISKMNNKNLTITLTAQLTDN